MRQRTTMISMAAAFLCVVTLPTAVLAQESPFPEGEAKALVEGLCISCHRLEYITRHAGHSREDWLSHFGSMIALPDDRANMIADYLATHFPQKPGTEPVVIPGPVDIKFTEWEAPTLGQRPHDPLWTEDGSIWWTGQWANRLGQLDPATGEREEFPLNVPDSHPHGLVEASDGGIWFTAVRGGYVGRFDPETKEVREFFVPEGTRGPHTPIFDDRGSVWFTMQSGHVGRIVLATEEMTISATPTANTYPYGIQVNSQGEPWYVDFRGNRLGSVDPATGKITEYELPNPDSRPRRIALTPDDAVWYTDYSRGYIGRFDPETGEVKEWPSPGGAESRPYGIASLGNTLWYGESYSWPNTLVRFDADSEGFQSWAIPSGGGVIRHMMATPDGNLVLACSGVNRVALVEVGI